MTTRRSSSWSCRSTAAARASRSVRARRSAPDGPTINNQVWSADGAAVIANYDAEKLDRLLPIDGSPPTVLDTGRAGLRRLPTPRALIATQSGAALPPASRPPRPPCPAIDQPRRRSNRARDSHWGDREDDMNRTTLVLTLVTTAAVLAGCADSVPPATSSGQPPASQTAANGPIADRHAGRDASSFQRRRHPRVSGQRPRGSSPAACTTSGTFPGPPRSWPTGEVLVAGGHGDGTGTIPRRRGPSCTTPSTGQWTETGRMVTAHRSGHTATLLPNGQVLVAGGSAYQGKGGGPYPRGSTPSCMTRSTGTWGETGAMTVARSSHIATLLPDGTVLVVGGYGRRLQTAQASRVYDPSTGTWARTRGMPSLARRRRRRSCRTAAFSSSAARPGAE